MEGIWEFNEVLCITRHESTMEAPRNHHESIAEAAMETDEGPPHESAMK